VEVDPTCMCELRIGLPDVNALAVDDDRVDAVVVVHIESRVARPGCAGCGTPARVKDRPRVELVDLPCLGRPARLVWHKHRWRCPDGDCPVGSWTGDDARIAPARGAMTDRAGRWATVQVGREGRAVAEVARELGSDWHTLNDAVIANGSALLDADVGRIGQVAALGLDETLFCRTGRWRTQQWCTSIVDVTPGHIQLLDVAAGRSAAGPSAWLEAQPAGWGDAIRCGVLDLSGPYRKTFTVTLEHVTQVADPFHLIKLANSKLDECRRRVQNETVGHRGRAGDPRLGSEWVIRAGTRRRSGTVAGPSKGGVLVGLEGQLVTPCSSGE
jgi:transposase